MSIHWTATLEWSEPQQISTERGDRVVRIAKPNDDFWACWRLYKAELFRLGFTTKKDDEKRWHVRWWQLPDNDEQALQALQEAEQLRPPPPPSLPMADIDVPVPEGLKLLPFQLDDVRRMIARRRVLLASEPGTGKTVHIAALCNAVNARRILIIAPAAVLKSWDAELRKWLTNGAEPMIVSAKNADQIPEHDGPIVVGYEMATQPKVLQHLLAETWHVLACDESHAFGSHDSQRTEKLIGERGLDAHFVIMASGTPFTNHVIQIWPQLHYLQPERWRTRYEFGEYFSYRKFDERKKETIYRGAKNMDDLNHLLLTNLMIRRSKADVLASLPSKSHELILVPPSKTQQTLLALEKALDNKQYLTPQEISEVLGEDVQIGDAPMSRIRSKLAASKVDIVDAHVTKLVDQGESVIVFAHHKSLIEPLLERWDGQAAVIVGCQTKNKTQAAVETFQAGELPVILCSIRAAGAGLTLTAATRVVFAECDWAPGVMAQAEDRAHRVGLDHPVTVQFLMLEGSLDEIMQRSLGKKRKAADAAFKAA